MEVLVGSVIPYAGVMDEKSKEYAKSNGWLFCDGSVVNRAEYTDLFKIIGELYGGGDAVNTFNLPNYLGQFLRGASNSSGIDPNENDRTGQINKIGTNGSAKGKSVGSFQEDQFKSHSHTYNHFPGADGDIASGRYWKATDTQTASTGGDETRPKNVYVNYLIRFKA